MGLVTFFGFTLYTVCGSASKRIYIYIYHTYLIVCCSRCHGNHACVVVYILGQGQSHNKGHRGQ